MVLNLFLILLSVFKAFLVFFQYYEKKTAVWQRLELLMLGHSTPKQTNDKYLQYNSVRFRNKNIIKTLKSSAYNKN